VRVVLSEKGISWEPVVVDLLKGEHRTKKFLRINPNGKVPVLISEGATIYDSTIINEYLEEKYPEPPLTFSDPAKRAEVRLWEDYADWAFLAPAEAIFIHHKGWRSFEDHKLRQFHDEIRSCLERLEKRLRDRPYLLDQFTLADIAFAPRVVMLEELGIRVSPDHKSLRAWIELLATRESICNLER
jgi:glutathione S-transferase